MTTNQPLKHQGTIDGLRDLLFAEIPPELRNAGFATLLANAGLTTQDLDCQIEAGVKRGFSPEAQLILASLNLPETTSTAVAIASFEAFLAPFEREKEPK